MIHDGGFRGTTPGLPSEDLPRGVLRAVYLHWTAGDYATLYDSYHVCIALDDDGTPRAHVTNVLRANMRDVRAQPHRPYAAHTAGRNSFAAGVAICGMRDATPVDFGRFPLPGAAVTLACATVARLCAAYDIPVDAAHVLTHAEAALADGYFGCGDGERWDIARLEPDARPLEPRDAIETGERLRAHVRAARA